MYMMNIHMNQFQKLTKEDGVNTVLIPIGMLEAHGEHCALSRKVKYKNMGRDLYPHANNGNATQATAEKGRLIYEALIPAMIADIEEMWDLDV